MLYKTLSAAVYGIDANIIEVEVDVSGIKTIEARQRKISRLVVPEFNAREAAMVVGVDVYPVRSLLDVIQLVNSGNGIAPLKADGDTLLRESQHFLVDFKDVRGQQTAKRALE